MGWLATVTVAAFALVEAVRVLAVRPHVVMYGDQALLELGASRAAQLDQLVGPYSRTGFHHPGPALFYLLALFVRILEPSGPGLYLGAVVINAVALVAAVAVLWHRLGPLAALWAAAAIDLFCLCLGVGTLREPWNPYLVVAPMILLVVLWAAGVTGSAAATVWTLVVASYLVQTHLATGPVVIVLAVILLWREVLARRRRKGEAPTGRRRWAPAQVGGVAALVLMWTPPVVELWRGRPNNVQLMWDFFTAPHATPPLTKALQASADAISIMPFGNHDYVLTLDRSPVDVAVTAALLLVGMVGAVWLGRRRHQRLSLALAVSAGVGMVIGTLSLTQSDGPIYLYFAVWLAYVPLSVLLALGAAIVGRSDTPAVVGRTGVAAASATAVAAQSVARRSPRAGRCATAILVAVALSFSASTVKSDLTMGSIRTTTGSGPWPASNAATAQGKRRTIQETIALTLAADGVIRPTDRTVGFTIEDSSVWPYVAGLVLELDERGIQSTVAPDAWELYFGHERTPGRPVSVAFHLYPSDNAASADRSGSTVIARLDGAVLTYARTGA